MIFLAFTVSAMQAFQIAWGYDSSRRDRIQAECGLITHNPLLTTDTTFLLRFWQIVYLGGHS
jgi:hypothetical protein